MAKGKDRPTKAPAGRPAPAKPSAARAVSAKASSASSASKAARPAPKPARKPAPADAHRSGHRTPAAKAAKAVKTPKADVPERAAKPAAAPAPAPVKIPMKPAKKVEAPAAFRREYKKWLERLLSLRQQLVIDGERLGEEGLKALEQEVSVDHMADYGSDSYEQDTTLALIENKSDALRDVDEAIRRMEAKTYGLCEECEEMIPVGRLEVLPHARYCVKCQSARESAA